MGTAHTPRSNTNAAAWGGSIDYYDLVYDADYVINVPKCKTQGSINFSMGIKGWLGNMIRPSDLHSGNLANKCAEAHLIKQEDFVVLDATRAMVTGGPSQGGTMTDAKIVVASRDAIAAEVTGLAIIRYFGAQVGATGGAHSVLPWDQNQIKRALALGFPGWLSTAEDFSYSPSGIDEHAAIMAKRTA